MRLVNAVWHSAENDLESPLVAPGDEDVKIIDRLHLSIVFDPTGQLPGG